MHTSSPLSLSAELNPKQREAVLSTEGPLLIIAGPGAGKTKTLTHRIAHLIRGGTTPEQILAVTFTNKAAEEMKQRVRALLPNSNLQPPTSLFIGTFHSFAARILRSHAQRIGYGPRFAIFDDDDSLAAVKDAMKELDIDPKRYAPGAIAHIISSLKGELKDAEAYAEENDIAEPFPGIVHSVLVAYDQRLRQANAMDFDDLLVNAVRLLRTCPDILEKYQNQFRYIHVDEYQDTNHSQYVLTRMLAEKYGNIAVVGDDAQSIYSFRGADMRNILNFERDWPEAKVVVLDQNYRSTQVILDAASTVIAKNPSQKEKRLWTERGGGEPIELVPVENERAEARVVADKIQELARRGVAAGEVVILYRTNAQSRPFEEAFLERGIAYKIIGGIKFYQRQEIKDILAYSRVVANPSDTLSLKRIINVPARGIGPKAAAAYAARPLLGHAAPSGQPEQKPLSAVRQFEKLMAELKAAGNELPPSLFFRYLLEKIRYREHLEERADNPEERWENVQELVSVASSYDQHASPEGLVKFLEDIALMSDTDEAGPEQGVVRMMTLHAAKGLEFGAVFLVGLEEGIFPHARSLFDPRELEEERRLCYVGLTRAKENVFLSFAFTRLRFGSIQANLPSRFLSEIPQNLIRIHDAEPDQIII